MQLGTNKKGQNQDQNQERKKDKENQESKQRSKVHLLVLGRKIPKITKAIFTLTPERKRREDKNKKRKEKRKEKRKNLKRNWMVPDGKRISSLLAPSFSSSCESCKEPEASILFELFVSLTWYEILEKEGNLCEREVCPFHFLFSSLSRDMMLDPSFFSSRKKFISKLSEEGLMVQKIVLIILDGFRLLSVVHVIFWKKKKNNRKWIILRLFAFRKVWEDDVLNLNGSR